VDRASCSDTGKEDGNDRGSRGPEYATPAAGKGKIDGLASQDLQKLLVTAQLQHRSGELAAAEACYLTLIDALPRNADLWHIAGVLAFQQGRLPVAIDRFQHAIEIHPRFPQALNNLALAYKSSGQIREAADSFAAALAAKPDYAEAAFNLALLREAMGMHDAAESAYRAAINAREAWASPHGNLGNLLRRLGRLDEAENHLLRASRLEPEDATALVNLALLRIDQATLGEARTLAERAASIEPSNAHAWEAAGTAARLMKDFDAATPLLQRATSLAPTDAPLVFELGLALEACADDAGARMAFARTLQLSPRWERARWTDALLLPKIVRDDAEIASALARFDDGVERIADELKLDSEPQRAAAVDAASSAMPFNLHYLPGDHTARQAKYADLVSRVATAAFAGFTEPVAPRERSDRIRVGFVSSHVASHVVMRYFADFMVRLDRERFETFVWSTGVVRDETTKEIAASVDHFTHGESTLEALVAAIRDAGLDVLVHLDVGLDPRNGVLAALRLAPVQAACYGHPVTTGLERIDYFLGGELLEAADSQAQYREKLVALPGLGASIRTPPQPGNGSWADALRDGSRPLAFCLQNLSKVPPSFDATIAAVLAESGARLVFFNRGARLTAAFRARLDRALDARGVARNAVHVENLRAHADFIAGIARADLVLDTPGFSGGATTLDALAAGTPVVCFQGESARGRQSAAALRHIGVEDTIVANDPDYVERAINLLKDAGARNELRARIAARSATLFGDPESLRGFRAFLEDAVAKGKPA
jgi:predicted O-linked N-acetylglucosamine transferase (SPINDLY family)